MPEGLIAALVLYALALLMAARPRAGWPGWAAWLWAALLVHTLVLAQRWWSLGHGPFTTLHEILSSSLWSLALIYALCATRVPELHRAVVFAAPVWLLLGLWLLVADPSPGHLPPTYDTTLLYLHAVVGKAYLGQQDFRQALSAFAQGLASGGGAERTELVRELLNGGVQAFSSGKYRESIDLLKEFLKYDSKNLQAYLSLAKSYWESGDKGKALDAVKEVLKLDPRQEEALRYMLRR